METLTATVVAMAIGAGLSPTLFVTSELLLTSPKRPRLKAFAFAIGAWAAFAIVAVLVFTTVAPAILAAVTSPNLFTAVVDIVLGAVLLGLAAFFGLRTALPFTTHEEREEALEAGGARPVTSTDDRGAVRWMLVGLVLTGRDISTMVLYYDALQHIAVASIGVSSKVVLTAVAVALASMAVWVPLVVHITIPKSVFRRVDQLKGWVLHHRRGVRVTLCLVFGSYLVFRGIVELLTLD